MDYVVVGLAGFLGAVARAFMGSLPLAPDSGFPFNTLLVNLTGSFLLGLFLPLTTGLLKIPSPLRLAISAGFLGSFTTFSTFALETVELIKSGNFIYTAAYVFFSAAGGILLALGGYFLAVLMERQKSRMKDL